MALYHFSSRLFIVAFVQAQMLRIFLRGLGTLDHKGIEGVFEQLEVWHVSSGYHHRERAAIGLDQSTLCA